jgi:hypothetical protein
MKTHNIYDVPLGREIDEKKTKRRPMKEQMIKKVAGSLLTCALLLGASHVEAQGACATGCDKSQTCCDWGTLYAAAAAQYFWPGSSDTRYAIAGGSDINAALNNGTYAKLNDQYIKHGGSWGVKVLGGLDKEWISFFGTYEWWQNEAANSVDRSTIAGAFLSVPGATGDWGRIRADQQLTYQVATVGVAIPVATACYMVTTAELVVRYVDLEQSMHIQGAQPIIGGVLSSGSVGRGHASNHFRGAGIGFGVSQQANLPIEGWEFGGYFYICGLVGEAESTISQFRIVPTVGATPGQDLTLRLRKQNYWIPSAETAFLFHYTKACNCITARIKFGWIQNVYFNALFDAPAEGFTSRGSPVGVNQAPNQLRESAFKTLSYGGPIIYVGALF